MLRISMVIVSLAATLQAQDHRFEMNDVVRSARLIDAIHACLIWKIKDMSVQYRGLTALNKPPHGFLQGSPGSWRIEQKEEGAEGKERKLVFYLSVSSQSSAFDCVLPQQGRFRMVAFNETGKDCSSDNISVDGKQLPIKTFVAGLFSNFDYSN